MLGEVLDFMRLIWRVDHGLQRASKSMEKRFGVTGPQRLAIRIIGRFPGIPAGQLAALLHLHPSTLTGIIGRLERLGLVRRDVDPQDRRRALLTLTAKGRRFESVTEGTVESAVRRALKRTAPHDVASTRSVLASIAEILEESGEAATRTGAHGAGAPS